MKIKPHDKITIEFTVDEAKQITEFLYEKIPGQFLSEKFKGYNSVFDLYENLHILITEHKDYHSKS